MEDGAIAGRTTLVAPGLLGPLLAGRLPDWIDVRWFMSPAEAETLAPEAEIGWFDLNDKAAMAGLIGRAQRLRWLNSIYAGLDDMPLDLLRERGVVVTNGAGINAVTIAEYVVMALLVIAKGYAEVVRAQDRHEWLSDSPGKRELAGSRALLFGAGAIGSLVRPRLEALEVEVSTVRRTPRQPDELGPEAWREQLGRFDWIILALPATAETRGMIGAAELAAMKPSAALVNVARGSLIDSDALSRALEERRIAAAFLDVTDPEPLPPGHPLWTAPGAHISMHLSGRAQDRMFARSAERFLANLDRWQRGEPLLHRADLGRGY